jgi:DNA polymerase III epsilon subunit-like protein
MAGGQRPVFVAYNAPFDWMFVNVYFYRYLGGNPFGHGALDMKAVYMGLTGTPWAAINHDKLASRYGVRATLTHNALDDAVDQALLFKGMLEEAKRRAGLAI